MRSVDTKRNEGVGPNKSKQELDTEESHDKRSDETGSEDSELLRCKRGSVLEKVVARGREHGRHREQE